MKNPPTHRRTATVAAGFVSGMLAGLVNRPGSDAILRRLLADAGIPETVLVDPAYRVGVVQYATLYNRLVREFDDEGFGLFSSPMRTGSFEFLCRSVITAGNLAEALQRAASFLRLVLPDFVIGISPPRNSTVLWTLSLAPGAPLAALPLADPARVFAFEWLLRLLHALACWLAGRGLALDTVRFPYPRPPHVDDYALIYTENSQFLTADATLSATAPLTASLAANLLELPVRRDDTALDAFLDGAPGKIALLYRRDRETVLRVRDLLRSALPAMPDLREVARRLNLSERTLHRRLFEEGTNFRAIRDALRRDIALSRLTKSEIPLATLAAELGYAEPSAFYRAVTGWVGLSPSRYRQQMRQHQRTISEPGHPY